MSDPKEFFEAERARLEALNRKIPYHALKEQMLKSKIEGIGPVGRLRPSLFAKVMNFLAQLTGLKRRESEVLDEIEQIERRHAAMRMEEKLRQAEKAKPEPTPATEKDAPEDNPDDEETPARLGLGSVLSLFLLFMSTEKTKKDKLEIG